MGTGKSRVDGPQVVVMEHGEPDGLNKTAAGVSDRTAKAKILAQNFARGHDSAVEGDRHRTRATKDRDRIYPRAGNGTINPRSGRKLPASGEARTPLSIYQSKQLRHTTNQAAPKIARTEQRATQQLITDLDTWSDTNAALRKQAERGVSLSKKQRTAAHRVSRAIRRYEDHNTRTHRVYAGLTLDNIDIDSIKTGDRFTFDQFTAASHNPHEIASRTSDEQILLEIEGSRGMYLGRADGTHAAHLLPPGIQVAVVGRDDADIVGPHGAIAHRTVLKLRIKEN